MGNVNTQRWCACYQQQLVTAFEHFQDKHGSPSDLWPAHVLLSKQPQALQGWVAPSISAIFFCFKKQKTYFIDLLLRRVTMPAETGRSWARLAPFETLSIIFTKKETRLGLRRKACHSYGLCLSAHSPTIPSTPVCCSLFLKRSQSPWK